MIKEIMFQPGLTAIINSNEMAKIMIANDISVVHETLFFIAWPLLGRRLGSMLYQAVKKDEEFVKMIELEYLSMKEGK